MPFLIFSYSIIFKMLDKMNISIFIKDNKQKKSCITMYNGI